MNRASKASIISKMLNDDFYVNTSGRKATIVSKPLIHAMKVGLLVQERGH